MKTGNFFARPSPSLPMDSSMLRPWRQTRAIPHSVAHGWLEPLLCRHSSGSGSGVVLVQSWIWSCASVIASPWPRATDPAAATHPQIPPSHSFVIIAAHSQALLFLYFIFLLAKNAGLSLRNQPDEEENYPGKNHKKLLGSFLLCGSLQDPTLSCLSLSPII